LAGLSSGEVDSGRDDQAEAGRSPTTPRYRKYERKPLVLSDREFEDLRAEVLARCQLKPETRPQEAPLVLPL
jgi:hypothetical protein